jgi:hypothetical protein
VLLAVATFLPWYHGPAGASANAWQAFGLIDLLLVVVALGAIAPFAASALGVDLPRGQVSLGLLGVASCATILVGYRLLNPPGADNEGTSVAAGAWIGLLVCAAVVVLAYGVSRASDRA